MIKWPKSGQRWEEFPSWRSESFVFKTQLSKENRPNVPFYLDVIHSCRHISELLPNGNLTRDVTSIWKRRKEASYFGQGKGEQKKVPRHWQQQSQPGKWIETFFCQLKLFLSGEQWGKNRFYRLQLRCGENWQPAVCTISYNTRDISVCCHLKLGTNVVYDCAAQLGNDRGWSPATLLLLFQVRNHWKHWAVYRSSFPSNAYSCCRHKQGFTWSVNGVIHYQPWQCSVHRTVKYKSHENVM